jgi:hypothetical protein
VSRVEVGDVPEKASRYVNEIRDKLAAMGQQQALEGGTAQLSPYELRQREVKEREEDFQKQAARQLEEQFDKMRAPLTDSGPRWVKQDKSQ